MLSGSAPVLSKSEVDGLATPQRRRAMFCILLGFVLINLASAIVNIALPEISHSIASSDAATVWVVNIYQLAATVSLLPIAAMAEALGLKRVYLAGLAAFTIASLGCALSSTLVQLLCARLIQGAGAACISISCFALARVIYPRNQVNKGLALVALAVAVPTALGPTVAAMILAVAKWPWLFWVNVPLGGMAFLLFLDVRPPDIRVARQFDIMGTLLNVLAFGLLAVGVGGLGVGNPAFGIAEIIAGLACFWIFFRQQIRRPTSMVPFDLLRMPLFVLAMGTSVCSFAAQILAYVSLPFMFERVLQFTPVGSGLLITPWPVMTAAVAPLAGHLTARYPASIICGVGLLCMAAGLLLMSLLPANPTNWDIVWRLALCGAGFGLFQTPNNIAMMTAGPVQRSSAASGMNAVARFFGWTLGSALVALVFGLSGDDATMICLTAGTSFSIIGAIASFARWFKGG